MTELAKDTAGPSLLVGWNMNAAPSFRADLDGCLPFPSSLGFIFLRYFNRLSRGSIASVACPSFVGKNEYLAERGFFGLA